MKFKCSKCKVEKDVSGFYKQAKKINGLESQCIACNKEYQQTKQAKKVRLLWRKNNKEKIAMQQKKYRENRKGYFISQRSNGLTLYHKNNFIGLYKTREVCKQVIAKHKLRIAQRKLEDAQLERDDYYDNL